MDSQLLPNMVSSYTAASKLLQQCLVKVCAETVQFAHQLQIMGVICVTVDHEPIEIVVKINDLFQKAANENAEQNDKSEDESVAQDLSMANARKRKRVQRRRKVRAKPNDRLDFDVLETAALSEDSQETLRHHPPVKEDKCNSLTATQRQKPALPRQLVAEAAANHSKSSEPAPQEHQHEDSAKPGRLECQECALRFATVQALKSHVHRSGHKAFKCADCGETRKNWSGLELHCLRHLCIRRWTCRVCGDEAGAFFSRPACLLHIENSHKAELARGLQPGDLVHTKDLDSKAIAYIERMRIANGLASSQPAVDCGIATRRTPQCSSRLPQQTSATDQTPLNASSPVDLSNVRI